MVEGVRDRAVYSMELELERNQFREIEMELGKELQKELKKELQRGL